MSDGDSLLQKLKFFAYQIFTCVFSFEALFAAIETYK